MKIKRFFAPNIRQAIRMVREEQGSDAVILSNTTVAGGVEIVAATDYDEDLLRGRPQAEGKNARAAADKSKIVWAQEPALVDMRGELKSLRGLLERQLSGLAWGELARRHPLRARLIYSLREIGLSPALARQIAHAADGDKDYPGVWRQALGVLAHRIVVTDDDILTHGGVAAFVGPTGIGKTTTIAKLAARFVLRHGARHVALVTVDHYRVGAHEQLGAYGRILGVPVHTALDREELHAILKTLAGKRLVLIDTAGMSQRDLRFADQLAMLNISPIKIYLVLSTTTQLSGLLDVVRAFQQTRLAGCILTKLDECTNLGGVISILAQNALPAAYISNGQRVPEDIQPARAHHLISAAVAFMQQSRESFQGKNLAKGIAHVPT